MFGNEGLLVAYYTAVFLLANQNEIYGIFWFLRFGSKSNAKLQTSISEV